MGWGRGLVGLARNSTSGFLTLGHLLLLLSWKRLEAKAARVVAESCVDLKHAIESDHTELGGGGGGLLTVELLSSADKPVQCDESIFIYPRQEVLVKGVSNNSANDGRQQQHWPTVVLVVSDAFLEAHDDGNGKEVPTLFINKGILRLSYLDVRRSDGDATPATEEKRDRAATADARPSHVEEDRILIVRNSGDLEISSCRVSSCEHHHLAQEMLYRQPAKHFQLVRNCSRL